MLRSPPIDTYFVPKRLSIYRINIEKRSFSLQIPKRLKHPDVDHERHHTGRRSARTADADEESGRRARRSLGPAHKPRFVDRQPLPGLVVTLACAYLVRRSRSFAVWGCGNSFFGPAGANSAARPRNGALLNEPPVRAVATDRNVDLSMVSVVVDVRNEVFGKSLLPLIFLGERLAFVDDFLRVGYRNT